MFRSTVTLNYIWTRSTVLAEPSKAWQGKAWQDSKANIMQKLLSDTAAVEMVENRIVYTNNFSSVHIYMWWCGAHDSVRQHFYVATHSTKREWVSVAAVGKYCGCFREKHCCRCTWHGTTHFTVGMRWKQLVSVYRCALNAQIEISMQSVTA